jgi:glycosyltransferase involved in cell wall biosynthesis
MKISVITVSYNSEKTIEKTMHSVMSQSYKDIEHIIVDGGSTDDTLEILENYKNRIDKLISEKDDGIYDAMNKGINIASGQYIFFLNSDDVFNDENVLQVFADKMSKTNLELYYGDLKVCENGKYFIKKQNIINKILLLKNTPCQPTTFYRKDVFANYGYFDLNYKIVSDYEWFLRVFLNHNATYEYVDYTVTILNTGGVSTNPANNVEHDKERLDVLSKYFSPFELKSYGFLSKYFRSLIKNPLSSYFLNLIFKYEL